MAAVSIVVRELIDPEEGSDDDPYTELQYVALSAVTVALITHYPMMAAEKIAGHSDIAPGRKTDPGPAFDWARYRRELAVLDRQA